MLIGAGFPAVVVSGVARASVIENNPREYPYPYSVPEMKMEEEVASDVKTGQKYKLRPFPDLESHLEEQIAQMLQQKADEEQRIRDEALKLHLEVRKAFKKRNAFQSYGFFAFFFFWSIFFFFVLKRKWS